MTSAVLDASAVLAFLFDEPGAEHVAEVVSGAAMSTVNWVEVSQRVADRRGDEQDVRSTLDAAGLALMPLTVADAESAAALRPVTRRSGLSLADRCALALAGRLGSPALTTDAAWSAQDVGVEVVLIR